MYRFLFFVCFLISYFGHATPPNTFQFSEARSLAAMEGKLHVVYFSAKWCAPCQVMKEYTWPAKVVQEYVADNCVLSFMDIDKPQGSEFSAKYGVENIPTIVVFNSKGENVGRIENSLPAEMLVEYINRHNLPANRLIISPNGQYIENPIFLKTEEYAQLSTAQQTTTQTYSQEAYQPIKIQGNTQQNTFTIPPAPTPTADGYGFISTAGTTPTPPTSTAATEDKINAILSYLDEEVEAPVLEVAPNAAQPMEYTTAESSSLPSNSYSNSAGQRFFVQIGAFRNLQNAVMAQKKYIKEFGVDTFVEMPKNGNRVYRVLVGNFTGRHSADALDQAIDRQGFAEAFVRMY